MTDNARLNTKWWFTDFTGVFLPDSCAQNQQRQGYTHHVIVHHFALSVLTSTLRIWLWLPCSLMNCSITCASLKPKSKPSSWRHTTLTVWLCHHIEKKCVSSCRPNKGVRYEMKPAQVRSVVVVHNEGRMRKASQYQGINAAEPEP